jgi:hypothetical protein
MKTLPSGFTLTQLRAALKLGRPVNAHGFNSCRILRVQDIRPVAGVRGGVEVLPYGCKSYVRVETAWVALVHPPPF